MTPTMPARAALAALTIAILVAFGPITPAWAGGPPPPPTTAKPHAPSPRLKPLRQKTESRLGRRVPVSVTLTPPATTRVRCALAGSNGGSVTVEWDPAQPAGLSKLVELAADSVVDPAALERDLRQFAGRFLAALMLGAGHGGLLLPEQH